MTQQSLFRPEALQRQTDTRFGEALFQQPLGLRIMSALALCLVIAALLFASRVSLKQTVLVRGQMSAVQGVLKVLSPAPGVVSRLWVVEGEHVREGQVLASVSRVAFDADGLAVMQYRRLQLQQQIARQQRQQGLVQQQAEVSLAGLAQRVAIAERELSMLHAQSQTLAQRQALSERELSRHQRLHAQGQLADAQLDRALDGVLNLQQAMAALQVQIEARAATLEELGQQQSLAPLQRDAQLLEAENQLAQLRSQAQQLEADAEFSLVAPADGIVNNLLSFTGAAVATGEPFLSIAPLGNQVQVLLYVPSRALGELLPGQQVLLSLDAYPVRVFGYFSARIDTLSASVMDPREHLFPHEVQEAVYLVKATPVAQEDWVLRDVSIRSGMQFSAYVVTGKQTLLQRVTAPLRTLRQRV